MVADFSAQDKFDAKKNYTQVRFGANAPLLETELNEMQKIMQEARAEIIRSTTPSGFLSGGGFRAVNNIDYIQLYSGFNNSTQSNGLPILGGNNNYVAVINGYKIELGGGYNTADPTLLQIPMPTAPTFGTRDDLVFLEAWFEEFDSTEDTALKDSRIGAETSRRTKLNWRIRTVAGVDFSKFADDGFRYYYSTGMYFSVVNAQGGNASELPSRYPSTGTVSETFYSASSRASTGVTGRKVLLDDVGLLVAGDGTQASKDLLKTVDGYVYALPMFRIKRRNSGGYRPDNLNGARDYYTIGLSMPASWTSAGQTIQFTLSGGNTTSTVPVKVGDIIGAVNPYLKVVSVDSSSQITCLTLSAPYSGWATGGYLGFNTLTDRPDGLFANIVDKDDIIDLRHRVSLNGFNYQQLLEDNFDKLLRGELQTKEKTTVKREKFGLTPAPLGLQAQLMPLTVKGTDGVSRDLVNELGTKGECEVLSDWTARGVGPSLVLWNDSFRGSKALRISGTTAWGGAYVSIPVKYGKRYLIGCAIKRESGSAGFNVYFREGNVNISAGYLGSTALAYYQERFFKYTPSTVDTTMYLSFEMSAADVVGLVDAVRIYEVDQATYDKIGVDAEYTGDDKLAGKFPYISSYPNVVENRINLSDVESGGFGNIVVGQSPTLGVAANRVRSKSSAPVIGNTPYALAVPSGYNLAVLELDWNGLLVKDNGWQSNGYTFTTQPTASYVKVHFRKSDDSTITPEQVSALGYGMSTGGFGIFVPYGRWLLPSDYANGDASNRLDSYFGGGRTILSDTQITETVTEVIESLKTPQRHITVTQAVEGKWAVNDTIKVKSTDGVVMGVLDSDTGASRISATTQGTSPLTVPLDDVSKISVNDTFQYIRTSDMTSWGTYTVTAIDTVSKTVTLTFSGGGTVTFNAGDLIAESTASSSTPVATATGLVGTWSGLGTREATFTVTTKPTTDTDPIKLQYSVAYPSGKGIQQVPSEIVDARVNGEKLVKATDNIIRIKANFDGKVVGSTDLVPHTMKVHSAQSTLQIPGSGVERPLSAYLNVSTNNSATESVSSSANGVMAQFIFSFDYIRAITDKLGEGIFADCPTLADKVAKARTIVNYLAFNWWGYGSSPSGYKATVNAWSGNTAWSAYPSTHSNGTVTKIGFSNNNSIFNYLTSDGYAHFIAYSEATDGTAISYIATDYVEFELQLNVAETGYDLYVPEKQFPNMSSNLLDRNQAYPVDAYATSFNNVGNSNQALSIDSPGVLKVVTNASTTGEGIRTIVGAVSPDVYTGQMMFKGESGKQYEILIRDSNTTNYSLKYFTATGDWQFLSVTYNFTTAPTELALWIRTYGVTPFVTTFYVKQLKIERGAIPTSWSAGRKKRTYLNYFGKVVNSNFENPHKIYSRTNTTFGDPSSTLGRTDWDTTNDQVLFNQVSKLDGVLKSSNSSALGNYIQHMFEFDLSHLGLSLSELKSALRNLIVRWTGYGKGAIQVVDPTVAPTLSKSTDASASFNGTYYFAYAWVTPNGETLRSPVSSVSAVPGERINLTVPTFPAGVSSWRIYCGTSASDLKYSSTNNVNTAVNGWSSSPSTYTMNGPTENTTGSGTKGKVWSNSTSAWVESSFGVTTGTLPATGSASWTTSDYISKDQKVYLLVHSQYPASATNQSEIYTDYIHLVVELADYVDYVPATPVKVRKETKEVKLQYPMKSNRFGNNGDLELTYKYIPYQGSVASTSGMTFLTGYPFVYGISLGTGAYKNELPSGVPQDYRNAVQQLPQNDFKSYQLQNDILVDGDAVTSCIIRALKTSGGAYSVSSMGNNYGAYTTKLWNNKVPVVFVSPQIVYRDGKLLLNIQLRYGIVDRLQAGMTSYNAEYEITGKPLVKGVI